MKSTAGSRTGAEGTRRREAKAPPILCDYCELPATRVVSMGETGTRRVTCDAHLGRGRCQERRLPARPPLDWGTFDDISDALARQRP